MAEAQDELARLLVHLTDQGLGDQVESWIDPSADNEGVSAAQLQAALPAQVFTEVAGKQGMTAAQVAAEFAAFLPEFIDSLTPRGDLPADDEFDDFLAQWGLALEQSVSACR
ncbi:MULTISPECIES: YidB family protein [Streptomyces]|nr:YidB family protein [Streptomyces ruber]